MGFHMFFYRLHGTLGAVMVPPLSGSHELEEGEEWVLVAPAGTGGEKARCSTVGGGTSFRAHIPTRRLSFQSGPYVEASLHSSELAS